MKEILLANKKLKGMANVQIAHLVLFTHRQTQKNLKPVPDLFWEAIF